jgi:cytosolic carboxypeptidase protein 2/3
MSRNLVACSLEDEHLRLSSQQGIVFDSTFESGNLMFVFSKTEAEQPREFHLLLQNDINTKGYANWFYFKLHSAQAGLLKFHLVNLQKIFSFFSFGMKPLLYSLKEGKGWKME